MFSLCWAMERESKNGCCLQAVYWRRKSNTQGDGVRQKSIKRLAKRGSAGSESVGTGGVAVRAGVVREAAEESWYSR